MTRTTASFLQVIRGRGHAGSSTFTFPGARTRLGRMWTILLLVVVFGLVGCDDGASPTAPGTPVAVELVVLDPSFRQMEVGAELRFQVEVLAADGTAITGRAVTWAVTPASVATVDSTGLLRAVGAGEALVKATVGGKIGTAQVMVADTTSGPTPSSPSITSMSPASVPAGSGDVEITLRGAGFEAGTGAFWNGGGRSTEFVSETELRVTLRAQDLQVSGTGRLTVVKSTGAGPLVSNEMTLVIEPAVTTLTIVHGPEILFPGETITFIGRAFDDQGRAMDAVALSWTSSAPNVIEIAADGSTLARGVGQAVITLAAGGKETSMPVRVTGAPAAGLLLSAWAPFTSEPALVRQMLGGSGAYEILFAHGDAKQPAISPDGKRVVFVMETGEGDRDLFVMDVEGNGSARRLTTNPGFDDQPTWSPDGRSIAFRSMRDGLVDIWVIQADGSGLRNLTDFGPFRAGSTGAERPAWSPDGEWVAFAWGDRATFPNRMSLSMIRRDGSETRRVTQPSAYEDTEPSFSPDGQHLVFRRNGGSAVNQIAVTDLSGNPQYLWNDLGSGRTPRWSADGAWVVYIRESGAGPSIGPVVLKQIGASGERRLSSAFDAVWTPVF